MIKRIEAVFENGVFRPLKPIDISVSEGQQVRILIETPDYPDDPISLLAQVYAGLSEGDIEEVEEVTLDRTNFGRESVE